MCASTAWQALDLLDLRAGATLLVLGAGGAVGGLTVQLAARRGLRVLGTAATRDHERLAALGTTAVADYRGDRPSELGPAQLDGALDLVGRDELRRSYPLTSTTARLVTASPAWTTSSPAPTARSRSSAATATPPSSTPWRPSPRRGELMIDIAARFPLADAAGALAAVAAPHCPGKVVLVR